ncbi:MAG TPA: ATP-binding protein [Polyangiaceae bacterium]|nr:ATP-binding protein [Polyangiaceae bacterium]
MNLAIALSIAACAVEFVIGGLALALASVPGFGHLRKFTWVALTAALYSAGDVCFAWPAVGEQVLPWLGRVNSAAACLHGIAWMVYSRAQYGSPLRRHDKLLMAMLAWLAILSLLPGLVVGDHIEVQHVEWAHVTYRIPAAGPFGYALMPAAMLALINPGLFYWRMARAGAPGARAHLLGFAVLFVLGINEVLVSLQVISSLYAADVGFLAVVLSVTGEMTYRVAGDALRLQEFSRELSRQVEARTRELSETRDNLVRAERLSALGRLSASIGHEINNPLSYVIGNIEFARSELERGGDLPQVLEALRDAGSGADRIRRIVRELKAFSRGSDTEQCRVVDAREVIDAASKLVWGELRHRAELIVDLPPIAKVFIDPTRLTQVFVNLLVNAAQAIPEQRAGIRSGLIRVRARNRENDVVIEVVDNGVGISPESRPHLFEPFFSTKPPDQGTGLGLFVSLGIVRAAGGQIEVESEVGQGTTVRVVLPAHGGQEPEPERSRPPPSLRERRILIVDDDVLVARTLARLLRDQQVEIVANGQAALDRLARHSARQPEDSSSEVATDSAKDSANQPWDLVLCDLMMPGMTGMELDERVRGNYPKLAQRFVFISGGGVTERAREFIREHSERVLSKPIDRTELLQVLARCVAEVSS